MCQNSDQNKSSGLFSGLLLLPSVVKPSCFQCHLLADILRNDGLYTVGYCRHQIVIYHNDYMISYGGGEVKRALRRFPDLSIWLVAASVAAFENPEFLPFLLEFLDA